MFTRHAYQSLREWRNTTSRKPLLVRGVRQCGKTSLIKAFGKAEYPRFHYINFELRSDIKEIFERNLVPERILTQLARVLQVDIDPSKDLVVFDEIQDCPHALTSLKYFEEELPELDLIAAGSLIGVRLSQTSFPVGKVSFLDMTPMSYAEFLLSLGATSLYDTYYQLDFGDEIPPSLHGQFWEHYLLYLFTGGLPEVIQAFENHFRNSENQAFESVRTKQYELVNSYTADIAKHSGSQNALQVERVLRSIPSQLSKEIDHSVKKFRFKEVQVGKGFQTFSGPIDWLVAADLVIKNFITETPVLPLEAYVKENSFKLFLFDVGILGALTHVSSGSILDQALGSYKGYYAENFVIQELKSAGEQFFYSWCSGKTAEIEFLLQVDSSIVPIEVKAGRRTHSKSLSVYSERYKPELSLLLSGKDTLSSEDGKLRMPLYLASRGPELLV